MGEDIENAVKEKFQNIAEETLQNLGKKLEENSPVFNNDFIQQINNHLSIYWLFEPIDENNGGYATAFEQIEQNLGAIKNVRSFNQHIELGRKCSLSGEQNALFFADEKRHPLPLFMGTPLRQKVAKTDRYDLDYLTDYATIDKPDLNKGEGLSAVNFVKRFYDIRKGKEGFPSTAKIACYDVWNVIKDTNEYKNYKKLFKDFQFDEQLLFEENLTKAYFVKKGLGELLSDTYVFARYLNSPIIGRRLRSQLKNNIVEDFEKNIKGVQKSHDENIKSFLKKNELTLSSYYALIAFDGDDMGKWLAGKAFLPKHRQNELEEYHQTLSRLLAQFAKQAQGFLDQSPKGQTIYAGGDDFMGFINLKHLFPVIKHLRSLFNTQVNAPLLSQFEINPVHQLTFSAGVLVAHYKQPLHTVLSQVRDLLDKDAKKVKGKNAFALATMKKSGEIQKTIFRWENSAAIQNVEHISNALEKKFSSSFIQVLSQEMEIYRSETFEQGNIKATKIVDAELERLLKRACEISNAIIIELLNKSWKNLLEGSSQESLRKAFFTENEKNEKTRLSENVDTAIVLKEWDKEHIEHIKTIHKSFKKYIDTIKKKQKKADETTNDWEILKNFFQLEAKHSTFLKIAAYIKVDDVTKELHKNIMQLYHNCTKIIEVEDRMFNFINLLEIIDFLKRKIDK